jgi:hypothetical protein
MFNTGSYIVPVGFCCGGENIFVPAKKPKMSPGSRWKVRYSLSTLDASSVESFLKGEATRESDLGIPKEDLH